MQPTTGLYVGTDVGGRWWDRYTRDGFFPRGNGMLWTDARGLSFHRLLAREPLHIPWSVVTAIDWAAFHAGRWSWGRRALRVWWARDGLELRSGFLMAGSRAGLEQALEVLRQELASRGALGG
jgi:hypothetical protein